MVGTGSMAGKPFFKRGREGPAVVRGLRHEFVCAIYAVQAKLGCRDNRIEATVIVLANEELGLITCGHRLPPAILRRSPLSTIQACRSCRAFGGGS